MKDWSRRLISRYLWLWARVLLYWHRPLIIGITGTVGKTTTKEFVASVLEQPGAASTVGSVRRSPANLNDDMGLPLAILGEKAFPSRNLRGLALLVTLPARALFQLFTTYPETLVLEFGAWERGDVRRNATHAHPLIGVVTNVGPAHLATFGTVEGVAAAKAGLIEAVPENGLVILGTENPYLERMREASVAPVELVEGSGVALSVEVARGIVRFLGIPEDVVDQAAADFSAVAGRLRPVNLGDVLVLDDAFNANPLSMSFGLRHLSDAFEGRRRVAILGWMGELGEEAASHHVSIGNRAREAADLVVGIGSLAKHYRADLWFPTSEDCAARIDEFVRADDVILLKGSHAVGLDAVLRALRRSRPVNPQPTHPL